MMEKMIEGICRNCAGWHEVPPQGPVTIGAPKRGICQMFPPTPVPLYDAQGRPSQQMNIRPATAESESCLHFIVHPQLALPMPEGSPSKQ
jgi:hypothetical protein